MNEKNIVKIVCDELDINQTELAKRLGVSASAVGKWHTREMPKIAEKALEYMLKSYKQEKQLKVLKDFKNILSTIE